MTYSEVKSYLGIEDLVSLLQGLGYIFNRQGKFDIRGEKTPSVSINPKDLNIKDFGGDFRGDVFDLLKELHGMKPPENLKYVMNFLGLSEDPSVIPVKRKIPAYTPPPKDNVALMEALKVKAHRHLNDPIVRNGRKRERYTWFEFEYENVKKVAAFDDVFVKLFEHFYVEISEERIEYIFDHFIGYDSYYQCPVIIVYDLHGNVVNIVKYRPKKDGKEFMKYLYLKAEETPDSEYLYPFQYAMEKMMFEQKSAYVGEGLKNAVNALVFGLPYVSTESTSGSFTELGEYLKTPRMEDVFFMGAFDGDEAGERAYKRMNALVPMENEFTFDSGMDFAEYLKEEQIV